MVEPPSPDESRPPRSPRRPGLRVVWLAVSLGAVAVALVVFPRGPEPREGDGGSLAPERAAAETSGPVVAAVLALPEVAGLDPLEAGWESEAVHDRVHDQLARLGEILRDGEFGPRDLAGLVADDFTCPPLRPADLRPVYESGSVRVRSAAGEARAAGEEATHSGPSGFAVALRASLGGTRPR